MTDEELQVIRARCEAATEGPWEVAWKTVNIWQLDGAGDRFEPIAEAHYAEGNHHNNATFIAHAREDIPALLDEVERLRADAELGRLVRDVMTRLSDTHPVNRYPALLCWSSESWEVQYIHESGIYDTDDDELSATPEDALRKADA